VSATMGLLHLPSPVVPVVNTLIHPGFSSLAKFLESLYGARTLVIRPGQLEFSLR